MRYHSCDLRKGRFSESGRVYLVTAVTHERRRIFGEFHTARVLVHIMAELQERGRADTLAYVVMPDHLHWLLRLGRGHSLSQVVGTMKSLSARRLQRRAVWQPEFHDHALRAEEDLAEVARYLVANPLRAGLVKELGQYPHWDAVWL